MYRDFQDPHITLHTSYGKIAPIRNLLMELEPSFNKSCKVVKDPESTWQSETGWIVTEGRNNQNNAATLSNNTELDVDAALGFHTLSPNDLAH